MSSLAPPPPEIEHHNSLFRGIGEGTASLRLSFSLSPTLLMASLVKREAGTAAAAAAAAASDDDDDERPPLPPPVPLDVSECDRGVWLIRLPAFAAGRWREACAEAQGAELGRLVVAGGKAGKRGPGDDEDDDAEEGGGKGAPCFPPLLRLTASGARPGAPTSLSVRGDVAGARGQPPARIFAVSGDGSCEAGTAGAVARASGRVAARLDAVVSASSILAAAAAGGAPTAAASGYGALARERAAEAKAAQEGRSLQVIDDPRPGALRRAAVAAGGASAAAAGGGGAFSALALKRAAAVALAAAPPSRRRPRKGEWEHRARAERGDVEAAIFRCFERQRHWTFAALHAETDQPAPWLREVLEGVAVLNKRGPLKGQWEQKKDFGE